MKEFYKNIIGWVILAVVGFGGYFYGNSAEKSRGMETKFRAYPDSSHINFYEEPEVREGRSLFFLPISCIGKSIEVVEIENGTSFQQSIIPIRTQEDLKKHCLCSEEYAENYYDEGVEIDFQTKVKRIGESRFLSWSWHVGGKGYSIGYGSKVDLSEDLIEEGAVLVDGDELNSGEIIYSFAIIAKDKELSKSEKFQALTINQSRSIEKMEKESKKVPFMRFILFRLLDQYDPKM